MAKKQFKTESKKVLDMMINSIYTHREIFLREIISNSSDAIDKMYIRSLGDPGSGMAKKDFRIDISIDPAARTITVSDNGIGMTAEEMEANLGCIAHSGTLEFKKDLADGSDSEAIGQFGVGFYSSFMVSDKVTVVSKAYGQEKAASWTSSGSDGYTVRECDRDGVGTDVIMHIKTEDDGEEIDEFLETERIRGLVEKYSDYIRWPIHMQVDESEWVETGEKRDDGSPKKELVTKKVDKVVNSMVPIWRKTKKQAPDEKCAEFYKEKFRDYDEPAAIIRVSAEGGISYKALLFIPGRTPYDFYTRDYKPGLQLYSNGVMIMEHCDDLLPYCFRFVRGVVDSPDFSLNISREVLQHDRQLKAVGSYLTKQIKKELQSIQEKEPEKYAKFWANFGKQVKYGVVDQYGRDAELLKDLVMFEGAKEGKLMSFAEYVKAMPEGQSKIYYVSADSATRAKSLPQAEQVLDKGYDVLVFSDEVDTFVTSILREFDGKSFCNVTSDDLGIESEEEKKEAEKKDEEYKDLMAFCKETLGDSVSDVKISRKLKNHAVLLSAQGGITFEMEKYFKEMSGGGEGMKASRVLELNTDSSAFRSLESAFGNDRDKAAKIVRIMYGQACILAGLELDDPVAYSDLVLGMLRSFSKPNRRRPDRRRCAVLPIPVLSGRPMSLPECRYR